MTTKVWPSRVTELALEEKTRKLERDEYFVFSDRKNEFLGIGWINRENETRERRHDITLEISITGEGTDYEVPFLIDGFQAFGEVINLSNADRPPHYYRVN